MRLSILSILASLTAALVIPLQSFSARAEAGANEFFESRIRPVLVERCFSCHSAQSEKLKGGLRLDSRAAALKGGDTRAALVPGDPEKSLLIEAIRYSNPDLQMPPKGRLSKEEIESFTTWIEKGAPWPDSEGNGTDAKAKKSFSIAKRRSEHWVWQPVSAHPLPVVTNTAWTSQPVDRFLLARLEATGLSPAPPSDRRSWIRRLYLDLTGLPPSPEAVEEFLSDQSPRAEAALAGRLLASPQFGERWARHWLDLVRYGETLGHEFDYTLPGAWRYRDYLIRAINADVPWDQLALEHLAGDTLAQPRRNPADGLNESIIGTAFFWLGQQSHSPVDVRLNQSDVIANQIDVLTKTFLGLTVACARCHDHKFDAVSTRDFYALYGILGSSRYAQRSIHPPDWIAPQLTRLADLKNTIRHQLGSAWAAQAPALREYFLAAAKLPAGSPDSSTFSSAVNTAAATRRLDAPLLLRLASALRSADTADISHPLHAFRKLAESGASDETGFQTSWSSLKAAWNAVPNETGPRATDQLFADFAQPQTLQDWFPEGDGFTLTTSREGEFVIGPEDRPVPLITPIPCVTSAGVSRRAQCALRSPTFPLMRRYIHVLAAGRGTRLNLCIDNFNLIRDPIYGGLKKRVAREQWHWITLDTEMWKGHRAYLEFLDQSVPDLADDPKSASDAEAWFAVNRVLFSDEKTPPPLWRGTPSGLELFGRSEIRSLENLADATASTLAAAAQAWSDGRASASQLALLGWLAPNNLLPLSPSLVERLAEFRRIESSIPTPFRVPSMADGSGLDESVFIRGNPKTPGDTVPRRSLEALEGPQPAPFHSGSGRAELARRWVDPSNPLFARVLVNRVWHHLFGRGIVPTTDDFGVLGQPPSHPELLDWLADWFRTEGHFSTKKLIHLLVTSSAYRMSSHPSDTVAEEKDPANLLWHRMPVRRLEGEVIRDAMLNLSGRLDPVMFGPPVPVHLTAFMEGRGRPSSSGPEDGAGRRSIYLEARRNFPSPLLRAFDAPVPFTTTGTRSLSNVPAQSLILMNDPFVQNQAALWARRALSASFPNSEARIHSLFQSAFGRPPTAAELAQASTFLTERRSDAPGSTGVSAEEKAWADLCHVLFNVKEFVFVN